MRKIIIGIADSLHSGRPGRPRSRSLYIFALVLTVALGAAGSARAEDDPQPGNIYFGPGLLAVSPDGASIYASGGYNYVAFARDADSGRLTYLPKTLFPVNG